jgi:hypothetical protein
LGQFLLFTKKRKIFGHHDTGLRLSRQPANHLNNPYLNVDSANRLVADTLEADWNERLRQLDTLQLEHERQQQADQKLLSDEARTRIRQLAHDFPSVWNDDRVAPLERKRMLALLIDDVTLIKAEKIAIHVRFRGGRTTTLEIDKPKPISLIRKTPPEVIRQVDELLETFTDRQVAEQLNALGYKNWRGESFTHKKVRRSRSVYHLKSRFERLRARGMLNAAELASRLGVSTTSIYHWGRDGIISEHRWGDGDRCLYEPPGDVVVVKGQGGRYAPTPPTFIPAQPAGQVAI